MNSISSPGGVASADRQAAAPRAPADAHAELSKYEKELSDQFSCPSSETQAGKQRLVDLSEKVHHLKEQIKKADEAKAAEPAPETPAPAARRFRFDGLSAYINEVA